MTSQEFRITKNRYRQPLRYCGIIIIALIFLHFYIFNNYLKEPLSINIQATFKAFTLIAILFFYSWYKIKKTSLAFGQNYLFINNKRYNYADIEKYWIDAVGRPMPGNFDSKTYKVLCIKVKNRFYPYTFYLQYNFSDQQTEEIINALVKTPIKYEEGTLLGLLFDELFPVFVFWGGMIWIIGSFF